MPILSNLWLIKPAQRKLIKLMYIIDREGLVRWGRSMTNDRYFSLDNGCILSRTKNLLTEESLGPSYWKRFISPPQQWQVELLADQKLMNFQPPN